MGLFKAASLIAGVTIFSKILGAVRDWLILVVYGAGHATDAYFAAMQIPSFALILLGGLGGPFHTAILAVLSRFLKDPTVEEPTEADHQKAKTLVATLLTVTGVVSACLAVAVALGAEPIFQVIFQQEASSPLVTLAAEHLRIMSPILIVGSLVGIFYGVLNLYHVFVWPSLSPGLMNVVMIAALLIFPNDSMGYVLAWSTLGGALAQFMAQLPDFWRRGYSMKPSLRAWNTPELKTVAEILFPAMLSTTIGQAMVYVDMFYAGQLDAGGWTAVVMANRLLQLPIGVLQTALLVPIFPRFTRWVAESNWDQLRRDFRLGVGALWFISFPILAVILLYTEPMVRFLFEHGEFTQESSQLVTVAVLFQSLQMIAYFARDSITRVFFAFHDSKTPFWVGLIAIGVKALLNWFLVIGLGLGVGGISLSTALITVFNFILLALWSKKHIPTLGLMGILGVMIRLLMAMAAMMGTMVVCDALATPWWGSALSAPHHGVHIIRVLLLSVVGFGVFCGVARILKVQEAQYLMDRGLGLLKKVKKTA